MTRTRKILAWSCASFVLLIAIVVLVLVFFDWNRIKPQINIDNSVRLDIVQEVSSIADTSSASASPVAMVGARPWIEWMPYVSR